MTCKFRRVVGVALLQAILLMLSGHNFAQALPCVFPKLFPELKWVPARPNTVLRPYDAILACGGGMVTIESNVKFEIRAEWIEAGGRFRARILPETLVSIPPQGRGKQDITVRVIEVEGPVLYSSNRELIERLQIGVIRSLTFVEAEQYLKARAEQLEELRAMDWESLEEGRDLGPWDMIWTRADGRVEIEFLSEEKSTYVAAETTVLDENGHPTRRNRLPVNTYLIFVPQIFGKAKVNRVLGTVLIARDRDSVRSFYSRHQQPWRIMAVMDDNAQTKWLEMLKKEQLE